MVSFRKKHPSYYKAAKSQTKSAKFEPAMDFKVTNERSVLFVTLLLYNYTPPNDSEWGRFVGPVSLSTL